MKKQKSFWLNLQLFADGAQGVDGATTGDEGADAEQNENVNFDDEFTSLINGKFKEQFAKKTQEIIDKRFKKTKELEAFKERVSPAVASLMEKYGLSEGEEEKLFSAMNADGESSAENKDNYKELLRKNASSWIMQGEEMKSIFPDFDLRKELRENPIFSRLLLSGVDLKTAYETVHKDEILSGAMAYTAGKVREQLVQGIQAKGMRPQENGVMASSAVATGVDVNALTSKDILKILKQVENGASISF